MGGTYPSKAQIWGIPEAQKDELPTSRLRKNEVVTKTFKNGEGEVKSMDVELFTWEKLDYVDKVKEAFNL